jgi:hypothetical protein
MTKISHKNNCSGSGCDCGGNRSGAVSNLFSQITSSTHSIIHDLCTLWISHQHNPCAWALSREICDLVLYSQNACLCWTSICIPTRCWVNYLFLGAPGLAATIMSTRGPEDPQPFDWHTVVSLAPNTWTCGQDCCHDSRISSATESISDEEAPAASKKKKKICSREHSEEWRYGKKGLQ